MKLITYLLLVSAIQAQTAPPTVLTMDVDIGLFYARDTPDWSKYGTQRGPVGQTPTVNPPFADWFGLGDIVSINGKAVKGTWSSQAFGLFWSPTRNQAKPSPIHFAPDLLLGRWKFSTWMEFKSARSSVMA